MPPPAVRRRRLLAPVVPQDAFRQPRDPVIVVVLLAAVDPRGLLIRLVGRVVVVVGLLLVEVRAVEVVETAAEHDLEVEHAEELQLQLVHLRVAHSAHAREEGVVVVAARVSTSNTGFS